MPFLHPADAKALRNLTAVDGSFFNSTAHTSWALRSTNQPAAKLHLHFSVFENAPSQAIVTPGRCSEPDILRKMLEPGRLYVFDRGYQDYAFYRKILDVQSSFIGRVKDNIAYSRQQEQELTQEARKAGVIRDMLVTRIGTDRLSVRAIGFARTPPSPPGPLSRQRARGRSALAHAAWFNCFAPLSRQRARERSALAHAARFNCFAPLAPGRVEGGMSTGQRLTLHVAMQRSVGCGEAVGQ